MFKSLEGETKSEEGKKKRIEGEQEVFSPLSAVAGTTILLPSKRPENGIGWEKLLQ